MKIKLDENLGEAGASFLKAAGCDVATVAEQRLLSAPDADIVRACTAEQRCLVTLDKDFSDPVRYPPRESAGIIVVRLAASETSPSSRGAVGQPNAPVLPRDC